MKKIIETTENELNKLISGKKSIDSGSEGDVYILNNKTVLKKFNEIINPEDYDCDDLLKYSDVENDSYYFAKKAFIIDGVVKAYTMDRCNGYNLTKINPLTIRFDDLSNAYHVFLKDTKLVSNMHIKGFDMMFNFMYDGKKFGAIDTIYYYTSDEDEKNIYESNISTFNNELALLLIDGKFDNFVKQDHVLNELYNMIINSKVIDISQFIDLFNKKLSEYYDKKIVYLDDAKSLIMYGKQSYPNVPIYSLLKRK